MRSKRVTIEQDFVTKQKKCLLCEVLVTILYSSHTI